MINIYSTPRPDIVPSALNNFLHTSGVYDMMVVYAHLKSSFKDIILLTIAIYGAYVSGGVYNDYDNPNL